MKLPESPMTPMLGTNDHSNPKHNARCELTKKQLVTLNGAYSFIDQYLWLNLPKSILNRLTENIDYNDFFDSLLYAKLGHERAHHLQNISTSYGMWKSLCLRFAGMLLADAISIRLYKNLPIHKYLFDSMPRSISSNEEESLQNFAMANQVLGWIKCMEHGHVHGRAPILQFPATKFPEGRTNPMWSPTSKETFPPLTGNHILEFQARVLEIDALFALEGVPDEDKRIISSEIMHSIELRLPMMMTRIAFRLPNLDETTGDTKKILRTLCFELCDFALNPPLNFCFLEDISAATSALSQVQAYTWEEVHLGWRFVRILDFVYTEKIPLPHCADVKTFVDDIAAKLQFASRERNRYLPNNISGRSAIFLKNISGEARQVMSELLRNDHPAWPAYFSMIHSSGCAGPTRRMGRGLDPWSMGDVAIQIFYSNEIICPECVSALHYTNCPVQEYLKGIGLE